MSRFRDQVRFIELAGEVNTLMPQYVISKITDGLNQQGKSVKDSQALVLGVAYKKNVDDMRESPSVELIELLLKLEADVSYHDTFVPTLPKMRNHDLDMQGIPYNKETLDSFDCVLIATDHDGLDYSLLETCKLVVDSRGPLSPNQKNIIRA